METKNNLTGIMLVIGQFATGVANEIKGVNPDKMGEARQVAVQKNLLKYLEEGLKLLSEGLTNPTPDDLSFLSLQTNVIVSLVRMANPEKNSDDLECIRVQIQNYAKFKAEAMDNSEKLVAYIESNIGAKK
jgi:hypothetical protein